MVMIAQDFQFQSTLPHGERPEIIDKFDELFTVSIHAPARGATAYDGRCGVGKVCFNPRSRTGSDFLLGPPVVSVIGFNPRSRTGSDTPRNRPARIPARFNPRSRTGSDIG